MNIILPKYLIQTRRFICKNPHCTFKFIKDTPSRIEKCPMCGHVAYDRTYKKGQNLDPYSASKLRWYSDSSGERHRDEIKRRKVKGDRQVITDGKGGIIDDVANIPVAKNMGKKDNVKRER